MLMWCLIAVTWAGEVWRNDHKDGSISFTDSPPQGESYFRFDVDGPPPEVGRVSVRNFPLLDTWDPHIVLAAQSYAVDAALVKAVILAESGMNPDAKSHAGAMGLMQLMPPTAKELGVTDAWDPVQNIDGGTRYLRKMLNMFGGDIRLALAGYNAGPGRVKRAGGVPNIVETRTYVNRVRGLYRFFTTERPIQSSTPAGDSP
jgi:hypothetical protein